LTEATNEQGKLQEIVGVVTDQQQFQNAVDNLLAAGFKRSDLSVLASHESLDASTSTEHGLKDTFNDTLKALVGEVKYAGPLGAAGVAVLFGGPIGVGALVLSPNLPLEPVMRGGGHEQNRRAGTHNVPGLAGDRKSVV